MCSGGQNQSAKLVVDVSAVQVGGNDQAPEDRRMDQPLNLGDLGAASGRARAATLLVDQRGKIVRKAAKARWQTNQKEQR